MSFRDSWLPNIVVTLLFWLLPGSWRDCLLRLPLRTLRRLRPRRDVTVALTGQTAQLTQGTLNAMIEPATSGQTVHVSAGTITPVITHDDWRLRFG